MTNVLKTVALSIEQFAEIDKLAQTDCNGNFSQALRIKLGEKPERRPFQLEGIGRRV